MPDTPHLARRTLLGSLAGIGVSTVVPGAAFADGLAESPSMALGPFYPINRPVDADADLTRLAGHKGRAKGQVIEVTGRVLRADGTPQPGAVLEVWQCNAAGRYAHPNDRNIGAALDADFQGFARVTADTGGSYRYLTILPAAYPANRNFLRAPHIHLDVQGRYQRLITQMYLPTTDAILKDDLVFHHDLDLYARMGVPTPDVFGKRVAGGAMAEKGADLFTYDVVLS